MTCPYQYVFYIAKYKLGNLCHVIDWWRLYWHDNECNNDHLIYSRYKKTYTGVRDHCHIHVALITNGYLSYVDLLICSWIRTMWWKAGVLVVMSLMSSVAAGRLSIIYIIINKFYIYMQMYIDFSLIEMLNILIRYVWLKLTIKMSAIKITT